MTHNASFAQLIQSIQSAHHELTRQASRAVNISLTLRNWLIGGYIAEYELKGQDRASYGAQLLPQLAQALAQRGVVRSDARELRRYRLFYQAYPQIREAVSPESTQGLLPSETGDTVSHISDGKAVPGQMLVAGLSFSHFVELIALDDPAQRRFYERECLQGHWSVRELKRQIASLYYQRSGLSQQPQQLAALVQQGAEQQPALAIRDPYVFEFLGLTPAEVMSESQLEQQLTDKLQAFLLELGHGFCFEARQKRIRIGGEHFFVDLVFYHRILKCHVLVELKLAAFNHENIGQLNTYVSWYRQHMMSAGDNPPIGILLCTDKNQALVEYALAGMDSQLFVSRYQLELPEKEQMQRFMDEQLREVGGVVE